MNNKFKIGAIVKVINGVAGANKPGTIVKVLSKPGRLADQRVPGRGPYGEYALHVPHLMDYVLCERVDPQYPRMYTWKLNNAPALYERISDLKLATKEEKKLRRKSKNQ